MLPAGFSRAGPDGPTALNPRQRLERPLSLTTRLRERPRSVGDPVFEPFVADVPGERCRPSEAPKSRPSLQER
jgi:hypothetical protein